MGDDLEKKEKDKYEDVDPWKLVIEVPQALLATAAVVVMAPLGWLLSIFDEDHEPELLPFSQTTSLNDLVPVFLCQRIFKPLQIELPFTFNEQSTLSLVIVPPSSVVSKEGTYLSIE